MIEHLQINDVAPLVHYDADGVQAAFTFPFAVFRAADLEVWLNAARAVSGFTVSGAGISSGGSVLFAVPPAAGSRVTLRRRVALERVSDFQTDGIIRAKTLNDELDYQVAALQQVADEVSRCVRRPFTSSSSAELSLPEPAPGRALTWNGDGSGLANSAHDPDAMVPQAQAHAQAAAASAAQADIACQGAATARDDAAQAAGAAQLAETGAIAARNEVQQFADALGNPLDRDQNLADLPDKAAARGNLGLAALATRNTIGAAYLSLAAPAILGRTAAGAGGAGELTLSQVLDLVGNAAQGDILYRGAAGWSRLAAGTSGQALLTGGAGANPAWGSVQSLPYAGGYRNLQVFSASGTFTVPAGIAEIFVEVWGGGGGGIGQTGNSPGLGGGGGGYTRKRITGLAPGSTVNVTVGSGGGYNINATAGTGGISSFGAYCSATGGTGGSNSTGGAGGNGAGGDVNLTGQRGDVGLLMYDGGSFYSKSGGGGGAPLGGFGGRSGFYGFYTPGEIPGGGGGGAGTSSGAGNGARGEVRVYW